MRYRALFCGLALYGAACGGVSKPGKPTPCSTNSDCKAPETCHLERSPGLGSATVRPPCADLEPCTTNANCAPTEVCGPNPYGETPICSALVCQTSCKTAGCKSDQRCEASGLCAFHPCDEPGAAPCDGHYECNPKEAASANAVPNYGSAVTDTDDPSRAFQRGCVRKPCTDPDGFVCKSTTWACDPANSTEPSGCVALPCSQTGHCSDDAAFICNSKNDGPRVQSPDVHGCVRRNCADEAIQICTVLKNGVNYSSCDIHAPPPAFVDSYGCVLHHCDERPDACLASEKCDVGASGADLWGCRPLTCAEAGKCHGAGGVPGTGGISTGGAMSSGGSGGTGTGGTTQATPVGVCMQ